MVEPQETFWVKLQPGKFLSDAVLQGLDADGRGVAFWLWMLLYCNNGKLKYEPEMLAKMCATNTELLKQIVSAKFKVQRGFIKSKRVDKELKDAQARINKGVKAAKARWEKPIKSDAKAMLGQCQYSTEQNSTEQKNTNTHTHARNFEKSDGIACKFSIDECRGQALLVGITQEQAEQFYNHYNSQGWLKANKLPVVDLVSQMVTWKNNQFRFEAKNGTRKSKDSIKTGVESFADQPSDYGTEIHN